MEKTGNHYGLVFMLLLFPRKTQNRNQKHYIVGNIIAGIMHNIKKKHRDYMILFPCEVFENWIGLS